MNRIAALDGFRALAVLLTMGYHYFARWAETGYYPYADAFQDVYVFKHGHMGVQLFFIISGFVISMTLLQCRTPMEFALKRFARLWPPMLLCSIITFAVIALLPGPFRTTALDFLPSLTFTDPRIWTHVLGTNVEYIDGVHWTLFVEVTFYAWAALLYFAFGRRFLPIFGLFVIGSVAVYAVTPGELRPYVGALAIPKYIPWFAAGVGFYFLFVDRANRFAHVVVAGSLALCLLLPYKGGGENPSVLFFFALFYIFIYRPRAVALFAWKPLAVVGAASYSLYLLHHAVGVTLIAHLQASPAAALAIGALVTGAAVLIHRYWEMPARTFIRGIQPSSRSRDSTPQDLRSRSA